VTSLEEELWLSRAREGKIPVHVGIIMDGNGRWAQKRGLPRHEGHRAGVESIRRCLPALLNTGIKYCSLFVFSTENWSRPREEINFLMDLVVEYAQKDRKELLEKGIRVVPLGRWRELPSPVATALSKVAQDTESGENLTVFLAINYGGRQEILDAAKGLFRKLTTRELKKDINDVTLEDFAGCLYEPSLPDLDLIIRTSGEKRLSNFLLWQAAYAELVFTDVLWPDFGPKDLYKAIVEYSGRKRRFGKVEEREG